LHQNLVLDCGAKPASHLRARRRPRPLLAGRPSPPVEVSLRRLVGTHLDGWRSEATERWGSDSRVWRQCCQGSAAAGPEDPPLLRWAHRIPPAPLPRRLEPGVGRARALTVTHGRQRRLDGTVGDTPRPPPTNSPVRDESVRGLSRTLGQAQPGLQAARAGARQVLRERPRSAKRQMTRRRAAARQRGTAAADRRPAASHPRLESTRGTGPQAPRRGGILQGHAPQAHQKLRDPLDPRLPWLQPVIGPTTRRVMPGAAVPAPEKVVSRFAPHPAIIRTGQPGHPTDCGRVLWVAAVEGGIISRSAVWEGNPAEDAPLPPRLAHPRQVCNRPPRLLAGERGLPSPAHERSATPHGGKQVGWPMPGAQSARRRAHEQPRWGRQGPTWRAGSAGQLRGWKRRHTLERCRYQGTAGMERWGAGA
jgi:IS5 family transposase